jgi:hypothetical protein
LNRKSKVATFFLSFFVPGTGHLYLGLSKTGLQFMIGFFACIVFISWLPLIFPFVLAILWFYALFDALQKATLLNNRLDKRRDAGTPAPEEAESELDAGVLPESIWAGQKFSDSPLWIGGALIVIGILLMLKMIAPDLWSTLRDMHFGSIILAVVLIGIGIWMIRNQSSKKS